MSYFVPNSFGTDTNTLTVTREIKVLVDTNDDGNLEDITTYVDFAAGISGGGKIQRKIGVATKEYSVNFRNNALIFAVGDYAGAACALEANINSGGWIRFFTGYVSEDGCQRSRGSVTDDTVTMLFQDSSAKLGIRTKPETTIYQGYKICDTGDTGNSLFHAFASGMGLTAGQLETYDAKYTLPFVAVENKSNWWKEYQTLNQAYNGHLAFRYDGDLRWISQAQTGDWTGPSSEFTFKGANATGATQDDYNIFNWGGKSTDVLANRVKMDINTYEQLSQQVIYKNTSNFDKETLQNSIYIATGGYWPGPLAGDRAQLKYRDPNSGQNFAMGTSIQTPSTGSTDGGADIESSSGNVSVLSFNGSTSATRQGANYSELILQNTGNATTITKLEIRGAPILLTSKSVVEDVDATVTNDWDYVDKTIPGKYGVDVDQAHLTTQWWTEFGKVKRDYFTFNSYFFPQVQEGGLITFNPDATINMSAFVEGYTHTIKGKYGSWQTAFNIREWEDFTVTGSASVISEEEGTGVSSQTSGYQFREIAPSDDDLLGYWPLNIDGRDYSGLAQHGDLSIGVGGFFPAVAGNGLTFDGVTTKVGPPTSFGFDYSSPFSITFWMKGADFTTAFMKMFDSYVDASNVFYIEIGDAVNHLRAYINGSVSLSLYSNDDSAIALNLDQWYFVAVTSTGSHLSLYMDGNLHAEGDYTATGTFSNSHIGAQWPGSAMKWDGVIDEFRAYSKTLSYAEVRYLHSNPAGSQSIIGDESPSDDDLKAFWSFNGTFRDSTSNGYNGTLIQGSGGFDEGKSGRGYDFDGALDRVDLPFDFNGLFSIVSVSLWFKSATTAHSAPSLLFDTLDAGNTEGVRLIYNGDTDEKIRFRIRDASVNYDAVSDNDTASGQWYHVVGTWNGQIVKLYIDGHLQSTTAAKTGFVLTTRGSIGSQAESAVNYAEGVIDEVRVYNTELTQPQVNFLFKNPGGGNIVGLEPDAPSNENLERYYALNGTVRDNSLKEKHGTLTLGLGAFEPGKSGEALHFDGATSGGTEVDIPSIEFAAGDTWTASVWVKSDATGVYEFFLGETGTAAESLVYTSSDTIGFRASDSTYIDVTSPNRTSWEHLVVTYDNTAYEIWLDGSLKETGTKSTVMNFDNIGNAYTGSLKMDGLMDEIRIYSEKLSPAEIRFLYLNPAGPSVTYTTAVDPGVADLTAYWPLDEEVGVRAEDLSGNSNHGTAEGTTIPGWEKGRVSNAFNFAGVNERIDFGNSTATGGVGNLGDGNDETYSFWMKSKDTVPLNFGRLFDKLDGSGNIGLYSNGTTDQLRFVYKSTAGTGAVSNFSLDSAPFDAEWHHIALTVNRTSDLASVFMDGVKDTDTIDLSTVPADITNSANFAIGATESGTSPYEGYIDEFRLFNKVLSPEEVLFLYRNPGGSDNGLVTNTNMATQDEFAITTRGTTFTEFNYPATAAALFENDKFFIGFFEDAL